MPGEEDTSGINRRNKSNIVTENPNIFINQYFRLVLVSRFHLKTETDSSLRNVFI
jgi:hypothetical protein